MNINLPSKYNNYENHLQILPCKVPSNYLFVNIHGAFGESGDAGSKSERLGKIISSQIAHTVHISTARNWELYKGLEKNSQFQAFLGKTFEDEKKDIEDSIDHILDNEDKYFGNTNLSIFIVANSWGGTLISTLVSKYLQIKKLVLCNSGIKSKSTEHLIFTTVPASEAIKQSAQEYVGDLLFIQGELDEIVPSMFQNELYDSYLNANRKKLVIEGANHNFSSLFGKDKELANKVYIDAIIEFIN